MSAVEQAGNLQQTETWISERLPFRAGRFSAGRFRATRLIDWLLGFQTLVAVCVLALILVAVPRSMADPDIWWHLRNAREMLAQHAFLRHDLFSFTAQGSPWIDHEWLAELPFYAGWRIDGGAGVYWVTAAVIEAIFAGVLWLCWRASGSWYAASGFTIGAAFLSTVSFGPRTLLFGWLCLVAELIVLEQFPRRPRAVLALPALFALWVNLHGSWMIGLTVLLLASFMGYVPASAKWVRPNHFTRTQSRMLLLSWAGIVPALFCNPWGWRLVAYPFNFAFRQTLNIANVEEWQSLDLHSLRGRVVLLALLLLLGRQLWRPRRWTLTELALLGVGLYSAFSYTRFLFLLALLAAPVIARSFARASPQGRVAGHRGVHAALLAAVFALVIGFEHKGSADPDTALQRFPAQALPALAHLDPHRRLFNEFLWGGYLEWYRPELPVFIDSRVDLFEYNGAFQDYLNIIHIHDTLALLDRYRIDYVFFEKDTPLVYLLQHAGGWKVDFDRGGQVLLERAAPVDAPWEGTRAAVPLSRHPSTGRKSCCWQHGERPIRQPPLPLGVSQGKMSRMNTLAGGGRLKYSFGKTYRQNLQNIELSPGYVAAGLRSSVSGSISSIARLAKEHATRRLFIRNGL